MGTDPVLDREQADNLKLKQGLWKENDKEIRTALDKLKKVKYIDMPRTKRERNYLTEITLTNARLWFRYRCQIIDHIKGNKSSMYRNNMACRLCTSVEDKTQEHLERCNFKNIFKLFFKISEFCFLVLEMLRRSENVQPDNFYQSGEDNDGFSVT